MANIKLLLSRLDKVRSAAPRDFEACWMACCPAHDDRNPSLSIALKKDGGILLNCFSGCERVKIVEAIGLQWTDLYPDHDYRRPPGFKKPLYTQKDYEEAYITGQVVETYIQQGIRPRLSDLPHIERSLKILHYFHDQLTGKFNHA